MDYVSDSRKENMMYSESLVKLGKVRSEIREIFPNMVISVRQK